MGRSGKSIVFLIFSLFILLIFVSCSSKNNSKDTFSFEQFQSEMKAKNYNFEIQHVEEDFIPTTRERMKISKDAIDIYLFSSNRKMEKDAKRIDSDGGGYSNGSKKVYVNWGLTPHFYKKGNIIVLYVGGNEKVISDLKEIFGEQFAGGK
jgi:hypothetical protein